MAFLSKYRNLRRGNTEGMREVEYNFGRMFHQLGRRPTLVFLQPHQIHYLGLYSHAVKHYERVLELAEQNEVSLN
jgi:general transcription factor 3C polypeptide 3 (transcription factor C subunit 4)